jgi:hypothetical protein
MSTGSSTTCSVKPVNNAICDSDNDSISGSDSCSDKYIPLAFNYNNVYVPVSLSDINMFENNCITVAALYNYDDIKMEMEFTNIILPEITMTYHSLVKLFFCYSGRRFNPSILNKIWNSIRGLKLANIFLKTYEDRYKINQYSIPATIKIKLHKECLIDKITNKMKKTVALNLNELVNALEIVEPRPDGKIYMNISFNIFSEALQVGLKIILPVAVSGIYQDMYVDDDSTISFDFEETHLDHHHHPNNPNNPTPHCDPCK